ncbi:Malic enzyme, partial [Caligus rogercresseyi]
GQRVLLFVDHHQTPGVPASWINIFKWIGSESDLLAMGISAMELYLGLNTFGTHGYSREWDSAFRRDKHWNAE